MSTQAFDQVTGPPSTRPLTNQAPDQVPGRLVPFDPLDRTIDFEQPYERDPEEPGPPQKRQAPPVPALDSEQLAGGHSVDSYAERNRIPEAHRKEGVTICYVKPDRSHWILQGGIGNQHWLPWRGDTFTGTNGGTPAIIRGGNADSMNFAPEARWVF
jgi:hypothetical protein